MKIIDTTERSTEVEILDEFDLQGEELQTTLDEIASINQYLGGNKGVIKGIISQLDPAKRESRIRILDLGCGNGDMLRAISDFGNKQAYNFELIGVDANGYAIDYARKLSATYNNISFKKIDVFSADFDSLTYDIAICTLTMHHFKEDAIISIMKKLQAGSTNTVIINDLHRSIIAYRLFQLVCWVFRFNEISRNDGLISILRGFKKADLVRFSSKLGLSNYSIKWKWAFRYQWIINK